MHTDLNKVIGASIFDFVSQGSRDLFNSMFLRDSTHNELSFIAQDGVQIPTLVSTKKIQLDVPTICAVITDLTQQKRDEEIINGARLLQSILAQSTEAVIVCDEKGQRCSLNPACLGSFFTNSISVRRPSWIPPHPGRRTGAGAHCAAELAGGLRAAQHQHAQNGSSRRPKLNFSVKRCSCLGTRLSRPVIRLARPFRRRRSSASSTVSSS